MAQDIMKLRELQWEQARSLALRAHAEAIRGDEDAQNAQEAALSCTERTRHALTTTGVLSPQLMASWTRTTELAQGHLRLCRQKASSAHAELEEQMKALHRTQEQLDAAERLAKRFKRAEDRHIEEKRLSALEDRLLARGVQP
ncbi:hypothetical protein [Dyella acidisoli]|nr:hypothetical protein [Dyella acidisoli]